MRRRSRFILPLLLIVFWAQVFAPIGARLVMAAQSDDSLTSWICTSQGKAASPDQSPLPHREGDECCGLCQVAHGPPATLHPALIGLVNPPALYRLITRDIPETRAHAAFVGEQTRARAPPKIS